MVKVIYNHDWVYETLEKASATVIAPNSFVKLASWLAVEDDGAGTALAFTKAWAWEWATTVTVIRNPNLVLAITPNANFAKTHRGNTYDIAIASDKQVLNVWATTTNVLKVLASSTHGTVGWTDDVHVTIASSIF